MAHPHYTDEELKDVLDRLESLKEPVPPKFWRRCGQVVWSVLCWLFALTVGLLLFLSIGCIPWVVSSAIQAKAKDQAAYSTYVTDMERLNTEREIAKLSPRPIMPFVQWKQGGASNAPVRSPHAP